MIRTLGVIAGVAGLAGLFAGGCGGGGQSTGAGGSGGAGNSTGASGSSGGGSTGSGGMPSTGEGGSGAGEAQPSFEPTPVGATWSYATTEMDDGGVVSGTKVVTVLAHEAVPMRTGITAARIHTVVPGMEDQLTWQAETATGIVRYRDEIYAPGGTTTKPMETDVYAPSKLRLDTTAAHLTAGATYTETFTETDDSSSSSKSLKWTVVSASESVTVPAGTFTTVHVQKFNGTSNKLDKDYWFARGVGKVKETSAAGRLEVLSSYNLP